MKDDFLYIGSIGKAYRVWCIYENHDRHAALHFTAVTFFQTLSAIKLGSLNGSSEVTN